MAATNFTYHQVQHLKFSTVIISRPCVLTTNSHCSLHNINSLVFITYVQSVYSAVRTEYLYDTDMLRR